MPDPTPAPTPTPSPAPTPTPTPTPTPAPSDDSGPLGRGGQEPQQEQGGVPEWLGGLPDELKADATLSRFKSVEELARGHVEAHKVAKSKVVLPKEGDVDGFARFAASIRPETPDAYEFTIPEGMDKGFGDAMKPIFHEAGLHPESAKKLVDGWNGYMAQQTLAAQQKGKDEMSAVEAEMGKSQFAQGKLAAVGMLNRLGIPANFEDDLSRVVGAGNTMRLLFDMAGRMGELGRVDATDIQISMGQLSPDEARLQARQLQKTAGAKLEDVNSPERKKYDELVRIAGSARQGG